MRRWLYRSLYASLFALAACGGGGGGCSSCNGVAPLPQGFPKDKRVENAANIRITQSGFSFLNKNLNTIIAGVVDGQGLSNGGKIEFPITTDPNGIDASVAKICEGGADANATPKKCIVEVDLKKADLKIAPAEPNLITIQGTIPVLAENIPGKAIGISIRATVGEGTCKAVVPADVFMDVKIAIETDVNPDHGNRNGLSRVKTTVDPQLTKDQVHLCTTCSGAFCSIGDSILEGIKGALFNTLVDQLKAPITDAVDNALCVKPDDTMSPPCPVGSTPGDGGLCRFEDGTCASQVLGTDGTLDLSSALASISPSTKGGLDFQLAVGGKRPNPDNDGKPLGDMNVINDGSTLSMIGGILPNPVATCVKQRDNGIPTDIPTPTELLDNKVANWPAGLSGPDMGIGLSQRFLDHAMLGVYNSGLLCIQTGTDAVPQLTSNTIGAIVPSMKTLGLQKQNQPIGIILHPGDPPTIAVGTGKPVADNEKDFANTDANLSIQLNNLGIDFYMWSSDRFIRAFTATLDLGIPLNLSVDGKSSITPVLSKIFVINAKVTNNDLVKEDPAKIESAVSQLISGLAGQFLGGALPGFDLSSATASLGIGLTIPPNVEGGGSPGITKLTKGTDDFLGIFASLTVVSPVNRITTMPEFVSKSVSPEGVHFYTMQPSNMPVLHYKVNVHRPAAVVGGSDQAVEHAFKVDQGLWHPWTTNADLAVSDDFLRLQGDHTISIRSRVVGHPESESDVMTMPVMIDADPPQVELVKQDDGSLALDAWDHISHDDVSVRMKLDDGDFSPWLSFAAARVLQTGDAATAIVEVKDQEGNVASISQELRGKIDKSAQPGGSASGCGCTVPGSSEGGSGPVPAGGVLALAGVAVAMLRLRERSRKRAAEALVGAGVLGVFGSFSGCSCSDTDHTGEVTPPNGGAGGESGAGGEAGTGGSAGKPPKGCDLDEDCVRLEPGIIGSYTSTASDGSTVWVAGYNEADYEGEVGSYGDLVVGKWDASAKQVVWDVVDGLDPDEEVDPTSYDVTGWRKGYSEPGDDVGLWTSTQIVGGSPMVSYFDSTHKALKLARLEGDAWKVHTVQTKPNSDIGRYGKLLVVGGKPVIAYLAIEPGTNGKTTSFVRIARASSATPSAAADWTFEDVNVNEDTPCRAAFCTGGTKCDAESLLCVKPATDCSPACKSGEICLPGAAGAASACGAEIGATALQTYPEATGLYISAAVDGADLGLVFYDRVHGNLHRAKKIDDKWDVQVIEGSGSLETDAGIGASLAIDGTDWHVSYVDGIAEALVYVKLTDGTTPGSIEVIDSGQSDEGPHLVGDDSAITVQGGKVRVTYQDATTGILRSATRASSGTWTSNPVPQQGKFGGFFSSQVTLGGKVYGASFWRAAKPAITGNVSLVELPD
jgi:hypothetical protein